VKLGDFEVNRLGFGAMRVLGSPDVWGPPRDPASAKKLLRRAYELGANFFDTAESYGPHTDEAIIAEAMHPYPKGLVIGTKCGLVRPKPSRWDEDGRPEKLRSDLEGSLKRLKLDCLHLWQLHAPDPKVPFADQVGVLADARRQGKVRHAGLSNVSVRQLEQARKIVPIASVQNRYSVGDRASEDVLRACEKAGVVFLPWHPLGDGAALRRRSVVNVSKKLGVTPAQVALAWLLHKSPVMLPIPGTSSLAHLEENMGALRVRLGDEDMASL